ncbi:MAG: hypothetical protein AAGC96_15265 [Pseudomonadota bacterium]
MTMIIDHSVDHSTAKRGFAHSAMQRINPFSDARRTARRTRREHEMLMSMSNFELHDIGLVRSDVVFGVSSGRGVFRDSDR